jgi:AP-1 complex subunit gamma-1
MVDLLVSVLDSPYANYLIRQFVLTSMTKISSRPMTSDSQQQRITKILDSYSASLELEIQQRAIEFESLLQLGEIKIGVLERMPAPEKKATVLGIGPYLYTIEKTNKREPDTA